jgi:hypothetical protein
MKRNEARALELRFAGVTVSGRMPYPKREHHEPHHDLQVIVIAIDREKAGEFVCRFQDVDICASCLAVTPPAAAFS